MYRSDRAVHVMADGVECEENDPRVAMMLVAQGGEIEESVALKYGLIPILSAEAPVKAKKRSR